MSKNKLTIPGILGGSGVGDAVCCGLEWRWHGRVGRMLWEEK